MADTLEKPKVDEYNPAEQLQQEEHRGPDFTWDNPKDVSTDDVKATEGNDSLYEPTDSSKPGPARKPQKGGKGKFSWKRKGPAGIIIGFAMGGGMLVATISPGLAGISFVQNVTDDVADRVAALTEVNNKILRNKLVKSAKAGSLRGCSKVSISCKIKTFSKSELARMEQAGVKVIEDGKSKIPGRTKASGVEFRGTKYTPDEWLKELNTNTHARSAQLRANNMKYRGLSASGPFGWVMQRFGFSKKAPGLSGSKKDRVNQLLTATSSTDTSNAKLIDVVDEDGKATGEKALVTDDTPHITAAEADERGAPRYKGKDIQTVENTIERGVIAKPKSLSATQKAAIGGASILGVADLACSIKNMIIGASAAAKVVNEMRLIQYGMPLATLAGKIMAGDASPEESEALGNLLTEVDTREYIEAIDPESLDLSGNDIKVSGDGTTMMKNPNYGKSAMDASLLNMSTNGGVAATSATRLGFMVGMGASTLFSGAADMLVGIAKGGPLDAISDASCSVIQNPFVRAGGIILSVFAAIGSGGGITVGQVAVIAGMIAGMSVLEYSIQSALSGDTLTELVSNTVGRGEALWTSLAVVEAATSRSIGMSPSNLENRGAYDTLVNNVKQQYAAMEKEDGANNPFDVTNKFSFLGAFARSINETTNYSTNFLSYIPGSIMSSINIFNPFKSAQAKTFNSDRFKQCDDEEYKKLGIDADVQCNVRYALLKEDLEVLDDIDGVVDYMENNGYVEEDTETGLPEGYTLPDARSSQQTLAQIVTGAASEATIGQFFDTKNYGVNSKTGLSGNEYGKYLEYCAYRTLPYGNTGEESGRIGGPGKDWETGANCMKPGGMYSYFRAYTLMTSVVAMNDEEETFESNSADEGDDATSAAGAGDIAWPLNKDLYSGHKTVFLKGHGTSSGTFVKPGGNTGKAADLGANSLGVPVGEPIYAILGGKVERIGGGHAIVIRSTVPEGGTVDIAYAHGHVKVKAGETVSAGQVISGIGNLGNSHGAHLHLDMNYEQQQFCPQDLFIFMNDNPGQLPDFSSLVKKASKGSCSRLSTP